MTSPSPAYSYEAAFSRNIGWVTEAEQQRLRRSRVCIAGLGGVGGIYLLTMARLGIGAFSIADFDTFSVANFNRQAGATVETIDRPKLEVMVEMARQINPELDIRTFDRGLTPDNLDAFLADCDVYLDGLDFFALRMRESVFAACARKGVPATTVAPLGMGAALLNFVPGGMSFEDYFGFSGQPEEQQALPGRPVAGDAADGLPGRSVAGQSGRAARAVHHHRGATLQRHRRCASPQADPATRRRRGRAVGPALRCVPQPLQAHVAARRASQPDAAHAAVDRAAAAAPS
jgi:hypothetical protein